MPWWVVGDSDRHLIDDLCAEEESTECTSSILEHVLQKSRQVICDLFEAEGSRS